LQTQVPGSRPLRVAKAAGRYCHCPEEFSGLEQVGFWHGPSRGIRHLTAKHFPPSQTKDSDEGLFTAKHFSGCGHTN
jgi:hypothetical protein